MMLNGTRCRNMWRIFARTTVIRKSDNLAQSERKSSNTTMKTPVHLNTLRTFEASARHQSFSAAALELNVTPAAVGQLVRGLEDWLGVALFLRGTGGGRALVPTDVAQRALPDIRAGLDQLEAGLKQLKEASANSVLTVTVVRRSRRSGCCRASSAFATPAPIPTSGSTRASNCSTSRRRASISVALRRGNVARPRRRQAHGRGRLSGLFATTAAKHAARGTRRPISRTKR